MNQLEGLLILLGLPAALLLSGYWLAALLADSEPAERLAFALAAGLGILLAAVAAVNFFRPLTGLWAYVCLAPVALTLLLPRSREVLGRDLVIAAKGAPRLVLVAATAFALLLLWPVIVDPSALFYDGTSNHDSFFWISGAEHLKRHTYMEMPVISRTQPLTNSSSAFIGWNPPWGRMGSEGLLALASSVVGLSPFKLYLYGTASLAIVWCALAGLIVRTFVHATPVRFTAAVVMCLQPIFIFFYGNANLPNLLGALTGTAAIIATERALRAGLERPAAFTAWATLAALSLHGLLCSYPEMLPFILLPCGLLWLRPWFTGSASWRTRLLVAAVLLAGLLLNPATAIRGANGFRASFFSARADDHWANLFSNLEPAEYIPGLVSLSISGAKELGTWLGWPLSVLIVITSGFALTRSRDRYGLAAGLTGGAVLLAYTVAAQFSYGWQKTVQFSGLFIAALLTAGIDLLWRHRPATAMRRRLVNATLAAVVVFLAYATVMNCRDIYKWSNRKVISSDWFALRDKSRSSLRGLPVLVDSATFRMSFFHGMWSTYFLPESHLYFGSRGVESGGYLRDYVVVESPPDTPTPSAVLVGRPWADAIDANSPRLVNGREYALLEKSNRVPLLSGVYPLKGVPDTASGAFALQIVPHSPSDLVIELAPLAKAGWPSAEWRLHRTGPGAPEFNATVNGASPWLLRIPLAANQPNDISVTLAGQADPNAVSFVVRRLRVETRP